MKVGLGKGGDELEAQRSEEHADHTPIRIGGALPEVDAASLRTIGVLQKPTSGDPFPIGRKQAVALALGAASGFHSRVPAKHIFQLERIRALRPQLLALDDAALHARYQAIGARLLAGEPRNKLVAEAFAVAREVSRRALGKEPYEVQLLGALALADRSVVQLKTGEGKTLTCALAAAFFALEKKGCHVVTTNGYLAERDALTMGPFYAALGLTVGVTKSLNQGYDDKRKAYTCDLTYGHSDTFAFDWLEDQVWWKRDWRVQRGLAVAIVDEADDVLLDSAHQPLVLCGPSEPKESFEARLGMLRLANEIVQSIDPSRHLRLYVEREKTRPALNAEGIDALERAIAEKLQIPARPERIWTAENSALLHQVQKSIEARHSVELGKDFIEHDGITLVNGGNGHPSPGARLRHGLMDALLLARGRDAEPELSVIGMISYQSFFNMYRHLAGITGTARGGKEELRSLYGLPVIEVPTHKKSIRMDEPDRYYPHPAPRLLAAVADVLDTHARGQPVLVSTISVAASKHVSARLSDPLLCFSDVAVSSRLLFERMLPLVAGGPTLLAAAGKGALEAQAPAFVALLRADAQGQAAVAEFLEARGLPARRLLAALGGAPHHTLNAETHEQEAEIVGAAGQRGAITVATQMAARGVDIPLGEGVEPLGGLRVVGIERKSNRRKDDQASGRAGRQGQPGSSVYYVSPADEVFTFLPAWRLRKLCELLPADRIDQPSGNLLGAWKAAVKIAQERAEVLGEMDRRRQVKLDGALELQRRFVAHMREQILDEPDLADHMRGWLHERVETLAGAPGAELAAVATTIWGQLGEEKAPAVRSRAELHQQLDQQLDRLIARTLELRQEDPAAFNQYLRDMLLFNLDAAWIVHLQDQEQKKGAAFLMADKDPYVEHSIRSSHDFRAVEEEVKSTVVDRFLHHLLSTARPAEPGHGIAAA